MGFWDKIRLGSALRCVGKALKWAHESIVDTAAAINPALRVYYDSELGSPIEKEIEKGVSASVYNTITEAFPKWEWTQKIGAKVGAWIAQATTKVMDASKLTYQIGKGRINADRAYREIAKRTAAGVFATGKVFCKFGHWIKRASDFLPEDSHLSQLAKRALDLLGRECLDKLGKNLFTDDNQDRMENFLAKGLRTAHTAIRDTIRAIDTAADKAQAWVREEKEHLKEVAFTVGMKVNDFVDKVKDRAKTVGQAAKKAAKKLWNIIWGK